MSNLPFAVVFTFVSALFYALIFRSDTGIKRDISQICLVFGILWTVVAVLWNIIVYICK